MAACGKAAMYHGNKRDYSLIMNGQKKDKTMKKTMILALAALFALTACNDNNDILSDEKLPETNNTNNGNTNDDMGPTVPLNITALSNTDEGSETKAGRHNVAPTVTTTGVTLAWENSDKIEVLLGTGMTKTQLSMKSIETDTRAIFSGDIATGGQEVTASTPLYSYVASEDITFNSATSDVTIDLTQQDGSIEDAIRHSLLLAQTTYGTGNVIFDYSNKLAIMELKFREVGGETGTGTVTFSADQGIPGSATLNLVTGRLTSASGTGVVATNVTFNNGEGTAYVAIAPTTIGANNMAIVNARVRIDINDRYYEQAMKNTTITAGAITADQLYEQRIKEPKVPIGSWLFSDGTWGEPNVSTTKNVIGIVYENEVSDEDKELGYVHGYAVSINDAPPATGLSPYGDALKWAYADVRQKLTLLQVPRAATVVEMKDALLAEPSGLAWTQQLAPVRRTDFTTLPEHQVADWAWAQYQRSDSDGKNYQSFLPTAGHMFRLFLNLGGLDISEGKTTMNAQGTASYIGEVHWVGQSITVQNNLVQNMTVPQGQAANSQDGALNFMFTANTDYWTMSEYSGSSLRGESFVFNFNNSNNNDLMFEAETKSNYKQARAFIAF